MIICWFAQQLTTRCCITRYKEAEDLDRLAEAEFERRAEKHFQGHRGLLNGRDYRWNVFRWITDEERDAYRENFDNTFPDAPGSPGWFEKKFWSRPS